MKPLHLVQPRHWAALAALGWLSFSQVGFAADLRWLNTANQPLPIATQAIKQLAAAENEGLLAADYDAEKLSNLLQAVAKTPPGAEEATKLDAALTDAVVRYANDLYQGRIKPQTVRENYSEDARPALDAQAALALAAANGDLAPLWKAATPTVPMYDGLRAELQRYLRLRTDPAWVAPLPAVGKGGATKPGQTGALVTAVAQRLASLGDLSPALAKEPVAYGPELEAAVKSFQARHDLNETGAIDRATVDALNVPPAERAARIAQTMERLRWAPLNQTRRMIVVNVPEYRLRAYSLNEGKVQSVLPIDVIVGKANSTRTPLFNKDMLSVEFSPYWNVPLSIARKAMLPRLQRDPGYVQRNNFEIVGASGTRVEATPENIAALGTGSTRIRQKPGRRNALGDIKFVFPNKDNIYLHHTSSPGLFKREDRALSHGCVRVEDPVALAKYVLQDDPQWPEQRIRTVMDKRISNTVRLKDPIPVIITYLTTVIGENGKLHFLPDIYGQDKVLKAALQKRK